MKITIIDGSLSKHTAKNYTTQLATELLDLGHEVKLIKAAEKKINFCKGCWSCWYKTPGECPQKDDMPELYRNYMKSDLVLHYSPLHMGFISSRLKTINDRTIPLVHPYMTLVQGECHHIKRYDKYPYLGLIVDPADADSEDIAITRDLYQRMALNFKTELKIFSSTQQTPEEISYEISNI